MTYLSNHNIVHRDVALRNILLTETHIVKLADFGLALDKALNPKTSEIEHFPIKWMSPEAISARDFSSYSDVWSFGVVLWELFTLGKVPYKTYTFKTNNKLEAERELRTFYESIKNGTRLDKPKYAPDDLYTLMEQCWRMKKEERPSFEECKNVCNRSLKNNFPSAYNILLKLLNDSQPFIDVKVSLERHTVTENESVTYLPS